MGYRIQRPDEPPSVHCCCWWCWCKAGPDAFRDDVLKRLGGPESAGQFDKLLAECQPLMEAASALPSLSLRSDKWAAVTMLRYRGHGVETAPCLCELRRAMSK